MADTPCNLEHAMQEEADMAVELERVRTRTYDEWLAEKNVRLQERDRVREIAYLTRTLNHKSRFRENELKRRYIRNLALKDKRVIIILGERNQIINYVG